MSGLPLFDVSIVRSIREVGELRNKPDLYESLFKTFHTFSDQLIVDMHLALESLDKGGLDGCVHRLKGSAGSLGAVRLASDCEELQKQLQEEGLDTNRTSTLLSRLEKTYSDTVDFIREEAKVQREM